MTDLEKVIAWAQASKAEILTEVLTEGLAVSSRVAATTVTTAASQRA